MRGKRQFALGIAAFLLACGLVLAGQKDRSSGTLRRELGRTSATAGLRQNPFVGDRNALRAGEKLFRRHCAECHGPEGRGGDRAPGLRSSAIQNAPSGALFSVLKNGNLRRGMPSWSRLPDQRLWQIVSYLQDPR